MCLKISSILQLLPAFCLNWNCFVFFSERIYSGFCQSLRLATTHPRDVFKLNSVFGTTLLVFRLEWIYTWLEKNIQRRFSFPTFETCRLPCGLFLHGRFPASYSFKEHKVLLYYGFKHHFLLISPCGAVWVFFLKYTEHWCISKSMSSLQWNTKTSQVWVLFLLAAMVNVYIYHQMLPRTMSSIPCFVVHLFLNVTVQYYVCMYVFDIICVASFKAAT